MTLKSCFCKRLKINKLFSGYKTKAARCLTVCGDLVGRVEPPVPTRRRADVHVKMDVVSQPEAALLVSHKYRLLPVLWPFTSAEKEKEEKKKQAGG